MQQSERQRTISLVLWRSSAGRSDMIAQKVMTCSIQEMQSRYRQAVSLANMCTVADLRAEGTNAMNAGDRHVSCHNKQRPRPSCTAVATDPLWGRVPQDLRPRDCRTTGRSWQTSHHLCRREETRGFLRFVMTASTCAAPRAGCIPSRTRSLHCPMRVNSWDTATRRCAHQIMEAQPRCLRPPSLGSERGRGDQFPESFLM